MRAVEQWEAAIGEELECQRERGNATDAYAVSVIKKALSSATYLEGFRASVRFS